MNSLSDDMGFLILSEGGDGLGLALRLQYEGHKVSMYIRDPDLETRGENLVEKTRSPGFKPVILADCTGSGSVLDNYRDAGVPVFGGSQLADRLECDRKFASGVFKSCSIEEPRSEEFNNWEEAREFVKSQDSNTRLVFKPEGKYSGNIPSYVSYDNEDMLRMLEQYKKVLGEKQAEFVLQEFIEGTCISSEAWFSIDHFIKPFNHTLERKQLLPGDIGPSGGCTGNVVWACGDEECPLCKGLYRLEKFLAENEYNGCIDINSVVSKEGEIYALEFTPRFGYDAFPTFLYGLFEGNFGEFLNDCSASRGPDSMSLRSGYAAGVRVSTPPWPSEDFNSKPGLPIRGLAKSEFESFYPYEVSSVDEELVTAGGCGIIGVCIGYGDSIEEAFEKAYKLAVKLRLPDKQYRNDLTETFKKDLRTIRRSLGVKV